MPSNMVLSGSRANASTVEKSRYRSLTSGQNVKWPDFNIHAVTTTMAAMRKAAGISLIVLGTIWLTLWASVMLRFPLPIPGFILRGLGSFAYYVDPVEAPIWGLVFLTGGVVLLWRSQRVRHS
jgi:hypothetical protein